MYFYAARLVYIPYSVSMKFVSAVDLERLVLHTAHNGTPKGTQIEGINNCLELSRPLACESRTRIFSPPNAEAKGGDEESGRWAMGDGKWDVTNYSTNAGAATAAATAAADTTAMDYEMMRDVK